MSGNTNQTKTKMIFLMGGGNVQPVKTKSLEIVIEVATMPELDKLSDDEQSQLTTATTTEGIVCG